MLGIFIRLFAEVASTAEATVIAERLKETLGTLCPSVAIVTVRPYWKIEEYQEICLRLEGLMEPLEVFSDVLAALGTGWMSQPREGDATWNPGEEASFTETLVRWAHVEVME